MFSFTIMLMLGVGLGYNHAYVEITGKKSRLRTDNETTGAIGTNNTNITESKEKQNILDDTVFGLPSDFEADEWRLKRNRISSSDANATTEDSPLSPTMVIPLRSKSNHLLIQILRKVEKQKKNITLEIVAT
ncbi:uncharacterized protein LOC125230056 [Leguminivora glycinivorella]|uniref:uncharacterized protein LOC125230056 n=1 Tax=Leguminivora glycinivorella TaxID=1035111 RepID=UPI00200C14CA|nr:uncharacterized protein LOC125230056 [Leguminivora glycinivorella]